MIGAHADDHQGRAGEPAPGVGEQVGQGQLGPVEARHRLQRPHRDPGSPTRCIMATAMPASWTRRLANCLIGWMHR